jgi:hypothetical protein
MNAEQELRAQLAEYLGTKKGAHDITDAVVALIREEIEDHLENSPHIYADGSTS